MFEVQFYSTSDDANVVDKTTTSVGVAQGELREGTGILHPEMVFELNEVPTFNYVKIPAFGNRYYFVDGEPVTVSYNLWRIKFKHDPLMNLKGQFRELNCIVERQENDFNPYLVDGNAPLEANDQLYIVNGLTDWVGGKKFNRKDNVLIVSATVCGSN